MVRALSSHQHGPGMNPGAIMFDAIMWVEFEVGSLLCYMC